MGLEIYAVGALLLAVGGFWVRYKYVARKAKRMEQRAHSAERVVAHDDAVEVVVEERQAKQPERVKQEVKDAVDNDFSDFYSGD